MKYILSTILGASLLTACSAQQIQTAATDISTIATSVQTACTAVNTTASGIQASPLALIPEVSGVIPYVTAACGTADAVASMVQKAVDDPNTIAWIENLNADLIADVNAIKSL